MDENFPPKQLIILRPAARKAKAELAEKSGFRRPPGNTHALNVTERTLAFRHLRAKQPRTLETVRCDRISREGAGNSARGGRAPGDYGSRISS
jgi:hypothetical protein